MTNSFRELYEDDDGLVIPNLATPWPDRVAANRRPLSFGLPITAPLRYVYVVDDIAQRSRCIRRRLRTHRIRGCDDGAVTLSQSHVAAFDPDGHRPRTVDIAYRAGDVEDVEEVAGLAYAAHGGNMADRRSRMARALTKDGYCLILAHHQGAAIGYGKADARQPVDADDPAPTGYYLTGLVVLPAWRRYGIGSELTRRRLQWLWSANQAVYFFTDAGNHASLALHAKLGFTEVGRASRYLGATFEGGIGVLMRADPMR